ncbi:MAG: imidazoleglycerol-phosphate dehydratase HisB [Clostridiales bacterium]|nr:imidazoleglycerol-phosphate dehydratase HisB [Clostridiales bacterium]
MRTASYSRKTAETDIAITVNIDGTGKSTIQTGIGFFDHMLILLAKHGYMDLSVACTGDTYVDGHHTVEDVGIALGTAIKDALGNKAGIRRYGNFAVPMDEALAKVHLDLSGRPFLVFDCAFAGPGCGGFDTQLTEEFFRGLAFAAGITLHMQVPYGKNDHHKIEALFKAFARALDVATSFDGRTNDIPSTKGVL